MVLPVDREKRAAGEPGFDPAAIAWPGVLWADVLFFCDKVWWERDKKKIQALWRGSYIITTSASSTDPILRHIKNTGQRGFEKNPGGVKHGSNSGYQSIQIAAHFGAKRIVLLGFDMKTDGNKTHVHGGYAARGIADHIYAGKQQHTLQTNMLPKFVDLVKPLEERGIEVLNASPDSALTCWPRITLDQAVELT